ncbi:hypothetical protein MRS44_017381 [Fusarium solani]|uniref:uncharacterized protein n=1 Tax=Fusarium solani TaxID=169388 RepID=UPI00230F8542|nr:hypothetical protein MRS44_017381 [Fusarium solani]KAJ4208833.1 hypothetical protein NW759_013595 [Fusarium solani]
MSSTASTATATSTLACKNLYDTPNKDATCGLSYSKKHIQIMKECCGDAQIVSYFDNCGLYCVALGQTTAELQKCMWDQGAAWGAPFCSNTKGTSLTADPKIPATAKATVISNDKDDDDDDDDDGDKDSDRSGTKSASSPDSTSTDNAAPTVAPPSMNKMGLAIGALLLSSLTLGAFQI